jgi:hypothetical protein
MKLQEAYKTEYQLVSEIRNSHKFLVGRLRFKLNDNIKKCFKRVDSTYPSCGKVQNILSATYYLLAIFNGIYL